MDEDIHVAGPTIAFYWDGGCAAPLWDVEGNLPDDPDWLARELGLNRDLITDLETWTADRYQRPAGPSTAEEDEKEHRLLLRIQEQLVDSLRLVRDW